jgi:hypothetical protein
MKVGRICTPEAARAAGEADARAGRTLDERYASICGVTERLLNRMYADAYRRIAEADTPAPDSRG